MKSSDVVAIISVLVAGVIAPVITMMSVRWQVSHASRRDIESERRVVLDEAIVEISRFMRATSQARAIWRHGHFDDSEEAQEQLRVRTGARQGAIAAYGRICLRFGPSSKVATSYAGMDKFMDALDMSFRSFRMREPLTADRENDMHRDYEGLVVARDAFLEAAHEIQLSNIHWPSGPHRRSLTLWSGRLHARPKGDSSN
jgi:hypothetical protein